MGFGQTDMIGRIRQRMNCQRSPCRHVPRSLRQWDANRRAQEREHGNAQAAENAKRAEVERKAIAEAEKIVAIWNRAAGRRPRAVALPDDRRRDSRPGCRG